MAKFKVIGNIGRYGVVGSTIDGTLIKNNRNPQYPDSVDLNYTSDETKKSGLDSANVGDKNIESLLKKIQPLDDAANKMVSAVKQGTAPTTMVMNPKDMPIFNDLEAGIKRIQVLAMLGTIGGIGLAYKRGSGVGGYLGFMVLGSVAGWIVALLSFKVAPIGNKKDDKKPSGEQAPPKTKISSTAGKGNRANKVNEILAYASKMGATAADLEFTKRKAMAMADEEFNQKYLDFKSQTGMGVNGAPSWTS